MKSISVNYHIGKGVDEYRINLIRAGMIGAGFHFPQEEIFLFPFLDYLHLLFQPTPKDDPIAFLIWQGDQCIHSTFADLYFSHKYHLSLQDGLIPPKFGVSLSATDNLWLTIHRIRSRVLSKLEEQYPNPKPIPIDLSLQTKILEPDPGLMAQAHLVLHEDPKKITGKWLGLTHHDIKNFFDLLMRSILHSRPVFPSQIKLKSIDPLNYENDIMQHLDSFRRILDEVFVETSFSQIMQFPGHEPQLGNVFCAIRTIQSRSLRLGAFPFTANLILSEKQRIVLEQWCKERCPKKNKKCPIGLIGEENCLLDFEMPLGEGSRSVADFLFCSGIIDFARKPGDNLWDRTDANNKQEKRRMQVENCIYPSKHASLYYVPIHVQGIPWLSIFTFSSTLASKEPFRWLHNYTFYRDIIQSSISLLSIKITQEYIKQLSYIASTNLVSWKKTPLEVTQDINNLWEILARIFPFPLFSITPPEKVSKFGQECVVGSSVLAIPGRGKWIIKGENNPFFGTPQVEWGRKSPEDLIHNLTDSIISNIIERSQISIEESSRSLAFSSHMFNTHMKALGFSIYECTDNNVREVLLKEYEDLHIFADFAMATVDKRRWHKIQNDFRVSSIPDLINYTNDCINSILIKLSNPKIIGDQTTAEIAKKLLKKKKSILSYQGVQKLMEQIQYHKTQIYYVLLETLTNGVKNLNNANPRLSVELFPKEKVAQGEGLFLRISNSTGRTFPNAKALAENMKYGAGEELGVMTIKMACQACGFVLPSWKAIETEDGKGDIAVEVQICRFVSN